MNTKSVFDVKTDIHNIYVKSKDPTLEAGKLLGNEQVII